MTCKQCIHNKACLYLKDEDAERCKLYADKNDYVKINRNKIHQNVGARKTIGEIIYEKRKAFNLTQKKLAQKIDSCQATVASWEHGDSYPNALFLDSMADVFGCTIDELCGRVPNKGG